MLFRPVFSSCLRMTRMLGASAIRLTTQQQWLMATVGRLSPLALATQSRCLRTSVRLEAKKKAKQPQKNDVDDEEDLEEEETAAIEESTEDDNDGLPRDYKVVIASVSSTRLDNVIKSGMGWKRKTIDEGFAAGKYRINGVLPPKKSVPVNVGDKLDVILCPNKENPKFTDIARLHVLGINPNHQNRFSVKMKKWTVVTVEEYEKER